MTEELTSDVFEAAIGAAPSVKQNLVELEVGEPLASDIPSLNISASVPALAVVGKEAGGLAAPALYVPALAMPSHPMRAKSKNGTWFELSWGVDLRHFGKVLDNRGNDVGPALRNFIAWAAERGAGSLRIPPGTFAVESPVTYVRGVNGLEDPRLWISGYGPQISRLVFDGASVSDGLHIYGNTRRTQFVVRDLGLYADGVIAGSALRLNNWIYAGAIKHRNAMVENVSCMGWDIASEEIPSSVNGADYWGSGIDLTGTFMPYVRNCMVHGKHIADENAVGDWSDGSPMWSTDIGLKLTGCYYPTVADTALDFCQQGLVSYGEEPAENDPANANESEMTALIRVTMAVCKEGIRLVRDGREPSIVRMDGCVLDYRDYGLYSHGNSNGYIRDCEFIQKTFDSQNFAARVAPVDIYLDHNDAIEITGAKHQNNGDPRRVGIHIAETSGSYTSNIRIAGNFVSDNVQMAAYLKLGSGVERVVYEPGIFGGTGIVTEIDESANGAALSLFGPDSSVSVQRHVADALQMVPTGSSSWTPVIWSTQTRISPRIAGDGVFGALSDKSKIVVPRGRGFHRARLRALVEFDTNATGVRKAEIWVNGTTPNPYSASFASVQAVSGDRTVMLICPDDITVSGGDEIQVVVQQSSGASLGVQGRTSLTVSFL